MGARPQNTSQGYILVVSMYELKGDQIGDYLHKPKFLCLVHGLYLTPANATYLPTRSHIEQLICVVNICSIYSRTIATTRFLGLVQLVAPLMLPTKTDKSKENLTLSRDGNHLVTRITKRLGNWTAWAPGIQTRPMQQRQAHSPGIRAHR